MKSRPIAIPLLCLVVLGCPSESVVPDSRPQHDDAGAAERDAVPIDELRTAAEGGDPAAQSELAFAHQVGRGMPADPATAIEWHRKAAKQGIIASQVALGRSFFEGVGTRKQPIRGLYWLRKAALAGDPNAQALLGAAFLHGVGRRTVRPDNEEAEKWLLAASEQGVARAKYDLATLYIGMDEAERGLAWLREAVDQDQPLPRRSRRAAKRGGIHPAAAPGRGVGRPRRPERIRRGSARRLPGRERYPPELSVVREGGSERLHRRAVYIDAQFNLALAYLHGTGVKQDRVRGVAWLEVCRDETYRKAIRALGSARSGLTPEQLEAVEQLHQQIAASLGDRGAEAP